MNFGADMVRDKPQDAFAVARRQTLSGIDEPTGEPIDPEPTVGISSMTSTTGNVFEPKRDRRAKRGARSMRAPRDVAS